ncbi:hypothetical protein EDD15DRAFT_2179657, partial [Pisolithus albus]
ITGHFNGYIHQKVLQCNISDTNIWMWIPKPEPEFIMLDWPEDKGPGWYPKQTGLLSDWGYSKDFSSNASAQRDSLCVSTFPSQAMQLMALEAGLDWAGPFGHSVLHGLEAVVWLMWVLCINLDGPFNRWRFKCDHYDKADHWSLTIKCITLEAPNKQAASEAGKNQGLGDKGRL